jgi:peroxiredoxin
VAELQKGDTAPAFELQDHEGRRRALNALRNGRIVLYFFSKADTAG